MKGSINIISLFAFYLLLISFNIHADIEFKLVNKLSNFTPRAKGTNPYFTIDIKDIKKGQSIYFEDFQWNEYQKEKVKTFKKADEKNLEGVKASLTVHFVQPNYDMKNYAIFQDKPFPEPLKKNTKYLIEVDNVKATLKENGKIKLEGKRVD